MKTHFKNKTRCADGKLGKRCNTLQKSAMSAAVRAALALLIAMPMGLLAAEGEDPAVTALTQETSFIDFGALYESRDSAKFGEYNGLGKEGLYGNGSFRLYGGGKYDSPDATRWSLSGNNLGLEIREIGYEYANQGKYRFSFGYSEFLHRSSDSYQTPYANPGDTNLRLPSTWQKPIEPQVSATAINFRALDPVAGTGNCIPGGTCPASGSPSAAQLNQLANIRNTDLPLFHNFDFKTKRFDHNAGLTVELTPQLQFTGTFRHELKQGAKPIGAISTISTFESTIILPDVVDTTTDQWNLGLPYTGDRSFVQGSYFGSLFHNHVQAMRWQDPSNLALTSAQSSAPSNQFHQLNITGGYNISPATKLVTQVSYGRNTQHDGLLTDPTLPLGLPTTSFDGKVITKLFDVKLTTRPARDWNVVAGYKYDDRDNQSPVNRFVFYDINQPPGATASSFNSALGLAPGTLASSVNIFNNRPFNRTSRLAHVDADYAINKMHTVAGGLEYQKIDRDCSGTWYTDCLDATTSRESTLRTEWRARWTDELNSRIGYAYSKRDVDYNSNSWLALAPMANVIPGAPTVGATTSAYGFMQQTGLTGWGPMLGFNPQPTGQAAIFTPNNNIITQGLYGSRDQLAENPAMRRYTYADRTRNKVRSLLTWDANEKTSVTAAIDYNEDNYADTVLGLKDSKGWTLSLDGTYQITSGFSINAFYTYEYLRSQQAGWNYVANAAAGVPSPIFGGCYANTALKNLNNKIDSCNSWTSQSRDNVHTFGVSARQRGLLGNKLTVGGDLFVTLADTDIAVQGGNYATIPGTTSLVYIPASDLPTVRSDRVTLRLNGVYSIDRRSAVRLVYIYERLHSNDSSYQGMQYGTTTTIMPTSEQSPNYTVNVVGVSYIYSF